MISRRQFLMAGGTSALAMAGAGDAFAIEPAFRLTLAQWRVPHRHWPQAAPPLKVGIITDLHAVELYMPVSRIEAIVARMNALKPDIIVLLGDYVASLVRLTLKPVPVPEIARVLGGLRAPLGVYAVHGNHDWWSDAVPVINATFPKAGIQVLQNQAHRLSHNGVRFWVAGLGDQLAYDRRPARRRGVDDLPGTLAQIDDDSPILLLAHEPDIFVRAPDRVTVTFSGHTHGGQVYLPFIGRPVIPSAYGQRFAYGHIEEGGRHLIVSSGLGVTGIPVRFMVPPEIALVTVGPAEQAAV
jgi:predicted MPP superfamily phosphohydrolase